MGEYLFSGIYLALQVNGKLRPNDLQWKNPRSKIYEYANLCFKEDIQIKKGGEMKKLLFLSMGFLLLALPLCAQADLFTFSGEAAGGIGSAEMDITITGNVLTAIIRNTSPIHLTGETDGGNSPGITAFGFNFLSSLAPDYWSLEAEDDPAAPGTPATIGEQNYPGTYWILGTFDDGVTMDYLFHTDGGIDGALFNPATIADLNNTLPGGSNKNYFTDSTLAMLTMNFNQNPQLLPGLENFYIRMQNVGSDDGSLKLYANNNPNPVPEPATMLLLGTGLICFAIVGRKRFFKK